MVVMLDEVCTAKTCPKMVVTQWEFLCAAHVKPKECCAIDYTLHTLSGFTALINNPELFPGRYVQYQCRIVVYFDNVMHELE
jgi:Mob1/phocein family